MDDLQNLKWGTSLNNKALSFPNFSLKYSVLSSSKFNWCMCIILEKNVDNMSFQIDNSND